LQGESEEVASALAQGDLDRATQAGLDAKSRSLLEFAGKVTLHAYKITPEDVEALRRHGYSDDQIAEAVYDAALFNFFTKMADAFGIKGHGWLNLSPEALVQAMTGLLPSR
jgi:alkylhydroperoxidase family enzyme